MGCTSFSRGSFQPRIKPGSSTLCAVSLLRRQGSLHMCVFYALYIETLHIIYIYIKCPSAPSHPSHIALNFPFLGDFYEKSAFLLPYTQTAHLGPLCLSKMSPFSDWSYVSLMRKARSDMDIHSEGGTVWDFPPSALNLDPCLKSSLSRSSPALPDCLQPNLFCSTSSASSTCAARGHCLP